MAYIYIYTYDYISTYNIYIYIIYIINIYIYIYYIYTVYHRDYQPLTKWDAHPTWPSIGGATARPGCVPSTAGTSADRKKHTAEAW